VARLRLTKVQVYGKLKSDDPVRRRGGNHRI